MQTNNYILLLTKELSGDNTPEESVALRDWIAQSSENQQFAEQIRLSWEQSADYGQTFHPDLDADFQQVTARIHTQPVRKVFALRSYLLRAAAVFVLLGFCSFLYFQWNQPAAALQQIASGDQIKVVDLPDGTHVWLQKNATLSFPAQFAGTERRVQLQGEGYFEVAHNAAQPFRVELTQTSGLVEVLGTQFDIKQENGGDNVSVLVRTGKVHFSPDGKSQGATLTMGQKAVYRRQEAKVIQTTVSSFNELAWQTGHLEFVSTPIYQVIADLEQYYQIKITLRNPNMRDCLHTDAAPPVNQSVESALKNLSQPYQMQVKQTGAGQYELSGGQCQ